MSNIYDKYREQGRKAEHRLHAFLKGELSVEEYLPKKKKPEEYAIKQHALEMYELLDMLDDIGLAAAHMDDDEFVKISNKIGDVLRKVRKTAGLY